jgi:shikimate kinase
MKRVFLVGFMGSGKSTVGKNLAKRIGWDFLDLDEVIEQKEGLPINMIFEERGEEYFRDKESFYLKSLSQKENLVIATGGGTPCFFDNMKWMNDHGLTVYLKADDKWLVERLKNETVNRPLLKGKSDRDLDDFISIKMREREKFYLTATMIIRANEVNYEKLMQHILA